MDALRPERFADRVEGGRALAQRLERYARRSDVVVLALPRGGVPVAAEVARALHAPLDVFVVRKIGMPGHREYAIGAIASGGVRVLDEEMAAYFGVPQAAIDEVIREEEQELQRREREYREGRDRMDVRGRTAILVDDGLATGSTMRAAVQAVRAQGATRVIVAVPVGAPDACRDLATVADDVVCVQTPEPFRAVGLWYRDFSETTDDEVRALLDERRAQPMTGMSDDPALEVVRRNALWFEPTADGVRPLIDLVGDARVVLIGEASHGTREFYRIRAELTKALIAERDFSVVAVEADWPDAYRANLWVRGASDDHTAREALSDFVRFPRWMWRNTEVVDFLAWLREYNERRHAVERTGFYGLDLYSLHRSIDAVLAYLGKVDPDAAERARSRYGCFELFGEDPQTYGYATTRGLSRDCEDEVTAQLIELRRRALEYARRDGRVAEDEYFFAEQNARLIANAETYYRAMFGGRAESWNVRDRHMMETLEALLAHTGRRDGRARAVVWAHNSHLGDARATQMSARGELNLGQLVRERFGRDACSIGFTTHTGTVTAARSWGDPAERRHVRPSLPGSFERLFHEAHISRFLLLLREPPLRDVLRAERLERAIGVIYAPETERYSHYFRARLSDQFDAVLHLDETSALEPLERWAADDVDLPETYPTGI